VEFNRGSAKTRSGIYRDLAVRHRKTEVDAMLGSLEGPLVRRTGELIHAIEDGRRVCERANLDLLAAYERLERLGRPLNAVIDVVDAPDRAASGPLLGVAVAVKDNMDMRGLVTTNASTVGVPPPAAADAEVVARLRTAGADLFCKTNLLEYAAGSVNPTYGMTLNPLHPGRTSGGSSSGSAALVGAGVCHHATGTDTGGSIRIPAAYCGIVGLTPTYGLVPVAGVFELSPTLDHVGPLARAVRGAAELLAVLSGAPCPVEPVSGVRVGVLVRHLVEPQLRPGVRDRVREAVERLAGLGFDVREVDVSELESADEALGAIVLYEAWQAHRARYEAEADLYGPGTRHLLELGREISADDYAAALSDGERITAGFDRVLAEVDVLAGPTVAYVAPPEDPPFGTPDGDVEARFTGPYNLAGMPAVSVPCGPAEDGLPAGLQLAAARGRDAFLLSVAAAHEEAFHAGA